jgi:ABC-type multidrug transport system fused ATPase/permease subunit
MPLSDEEQRILREIEANLSVTDPKLVQQVSDTTLYRHSARLIKWSIIGFVGGLVLLLFTFTSVLLLGVLGFLIMLFCLLVIERNVRKIGRAGFDSLTSGMRPSGSMKGMFGNFGRRWRERWQRDDGS